MVVGEFTWARTPKIVFGAGVTARLGELVGELGRSAALVIGSRSLKAGGRLTALTSRLEEAGVRWQTIEVAGEPGGGLVNEATARLREFGCDVVVAVGGGSVLDAGKAISAMLPQDAPVEEYLEGVGGRRHDGRKVSFVAVPTTAGTGSEATVNAVLSRVGVDGYKASLRHPNLGPEVALVDPELALTCPREVTAACGMDALTQLLEAYVSTRATVLTDAVAWSGLQAAFASLLPACERGAEDVEARGGMAYAALASGLALAHAGLGVVHGLAGRIGGLIDVPHGVVCGTLLAVATRMNVERLRESGGLALAKYAAAGRLLGAESDDLSAGAEFLVRQLTRWVEELGLPRLGAYGISGADVGAIVARASNKNNPVELSPEEMQSLLQERL